jgi:uncharacterized protein (DUF488 family)
VEQQVRTASSTILTVGHSTHTYDHFLSLLRSNEVTAIADVRSTPMSRHFPHFNRDEFRNALRVSDISYVFLGNELGGRPRNKSMYSDGIADYEKMAASPEFEGGLSRLIDGTKTYRIALMCSERDPLDCHRCLLVGRALNERDVNVDHIVADGSLMNQTKLESQLLSLAGRSEDDLFLPQKERLAAAYRSRSRRVAFSDVQSDSDKKTAVA